MTPLPKCAMQIPLFIYDTGGMIIGHDDPAIGYTEKQMIDYGKAEYERGLLAAMNATLAFGKTGRVIAMVIRQLKEKNT